MDRGDRLGALEGAAYVVAHAAYLRDDDPILPILLTERALSQRDFMLFGDGDVAVARAYRDTLRSGRSWTALLYEVVLNSDRGPLDGFAVECTEPGEHSVELLLWPWQLEEGRLVLLAPRIDGGATKATGEIADRLRVGLRAHADHLRHVRDEEDAT